MRQECTLITWEEVGVPSRGVEGLRVVPRQALYKMEGDVIQSTLCSALLCGGGGLNPGGGGKRGGGCCMSGGLGGGGPCNWP